MTDALTQHYRLPDGVLALRTVQGMDLPELPEGATPVTPEEYETELAALKVQQEEYRARLDAEDQERVRGDYDALRELGVPEATAARITGYRGGEGA